MDGKNALGRRISLLNDPVGDSASRGSPSVAARSRPPFIVVGESSRNNSSTSTSTSSSSRNGSACWSIARKDAEDVTPPSPARLTSLAFRPPTTTTTTTLTNSSITSNHNNNNITAATTTTRALHRPSYSRASPSRSYSHTSSSSFFSTPPELIRSDSSDSTSSSVMMNRSPSPTTPTFVDYTGGLQVADMTGVAMDPKLAGDDHFQASATFYAQPDPSSLTGYAPIMQQQSPSSQHYSPYAAHPATIAPQPVQQQQQPQPQHLQQPGSSSVSDHTDTSPHISAGTSTSTAKTAPKHPTKKNTYPCPLAKQYSCSDHFTTSGHAARHAKKHTGKKDAFCPECNKAFTRKDNMEQHRRTHQNGRTSSRNGESSTKRQKTTKRASVSAATPVDTSLQGLAGQIPLSTPILDPSLPHSPTSSMGFPEFVPSLNAGLQFPDSMLQPSFAVDPALMGLGNVYSTTMPTNALDTLAIAAARREQKNNMHNNYI